MTQITQAQTLLQQITTKDWKTEIKVKADTPQAEKDINDWIKNFKPVAIQVPIHPYVIANEIREIVESEVRQALAPGGVARFY
jgi:hypothetical protein